MCMSVRAGTVVFGLWIALSPVLAQQSPAQNPAMENPSVVTPKSSVALSPGANSFSEGQARDLLKSHGYSDISPLVNDSAGIWRGTGVSGGTRTRVSVDFKGHISAQPE